MTVILLETFSRYTTTLDVFIIFSIDKIKIPFLQKYKLNDSIPSVLKLHSYNWRYKSLKNFRPHMVDVSWRKIK